MQKRYKRNRKRSKRRAIYCPIHNCYIDSVSQKYPLFADRAGQLQERGLARKYALMLVASQTAVLLKGEWLEAFWCKHCQETKWYHLRKHDNSYSLSLAPKEIWQQAAGLNDPNRNPSVSEFTSKQARGTTLM